MQDTYPTSAARRCDGHSRRDVLQLGVLSCLGLGLSDLLRCRSVQAAGRRLLDEMDARLEALREARQGVAATIAAWDARLAETPEGTPARLLEMIPALPPRRHI